MALNPLMSLRAIDRSTERAPFRYQPLQVALLQIGAAYSSEAFATATSSFLAGYLGPPTFGMSLASEVAAFLLA